MGGSSHTRTQTHDMQTFATAADSKLYHTSHAHTKRRQILIFFFFFACVYAGSSSSESAAEPHRAVELLFFVHPSWPGLGTHARERKTAQAGACALAHGGRALNGFAGVTQSGQAECVGGAAHRGQIHLSGVVLHTRGGGNRASVGAETSSAHAQATATQSPRRGATQRSRCALSQSRRRASARDREEPLLRAQRYCALSCTGAIQTRRRGGKCEKSITRRDFFLCVLNLRCT